MEYLIKMQVLDRKQRSISIPILRGASGAEVAYRRFSGFRSRCTMPFSCRYCKERQTGVNIHHLQPFRQLPLWLQGAPSYKLECPLQPDGMIQIHKKCVCNISQESKVLGWMLFLSLSLSLGLGSANHRSPKLKYTEEGRQCRIHVLLHVAAMIR